MTHSNNLAAIQNNFDQALSSAKNTEDINKLKIKYLGRKGLINNLFSNIERLNKNEAKKAGTTINHLKQYISDKLSKKNSQILKESDLKSDTDPTLPGKIIQTGSLHLVTYAIEMITEIFLRLGFSEMSYPEVEWEYFAFESLNMPPSHPARDDFETFYIDHNPHPEYGRMLLTPHTSSGQYREIKRVGEPPIKMINISKTYRRNWDVSHTPMFHQFEGLCIDQNITIVNLKGTIEYFIKNFFGNKRRIRLRPFHFQFTEPSFEIDISCDLCQGMGTTEGKKCRMCKSGWLELGGAGMVHPFVLDNAGLNSNQYSGWAFGFGIERVVMMKEKLNIDNLRLLYTNDLDFLKQF